ncbi:unnamed protein product [Dibothriocephalus latus]|uniref:Uncharacterized protein n=1 Tax=Dibothriocephalus latus TaxID=60516 RepID=A0A3P7LHT1_DIBLA|nr:unnamed protein product [Dibothriocephalus latus]
MACSLLRPQAEGDSTAEAEPGSPGPSDRPQREAVWLMPKDAQHLAAIGVPNNQLVADSVERELVVGTELDLNSNNQGPATVRTELRSGKVYRKLKERICSHMRKRKRKYQDDEESEEG